MVYEIRWDEFCMADSATTINENGIRSVGSMLFEACGPEVFGLTGA